MDEYTESLKAANEQLMTCPFCGSKAHVKEHVFHTHRATYGVRCDNENCLAESDQYYDTMGEAVAAWNTRVAAAPHEMSARELLLTEERMLRDDADAYREYAPLAWNRKVDEAVAFAEQWAREHPEEVKGEID